MIREALFVSLVIFGTSFIQLRAETVKTDILNESGGIVKIPAVYIQTSKDGKSVVETLEFTDTTKERLLKSLEGLISIFEKTNEDLKEKKSILRISEVEINASLEGKIGFKIIEGSSQASLKIILRPKN
ncbi:MAG: hypothetical protein KKC39_08315 [Candidatus Omnitrophica bacterium]|nr:hypothetical protein [Candidatus Omnitrophota bacterium]MBU4302846.1 hypothetical protein [Candidatus Omnitrophota bacterium]MBU4468721.1 hypothetical protein [Candidatus Omnitrophota bacterium]MCG2707740.1 hypothetical protein [Candidatus Omnitrophota bacterium]